MPLGSTEQYAYLGLSVNSILSKTDPAASHVSWSENFPWTRLPGIAMPDQQKSPIDFDLMRILSPQALRDYLGDGNFGGVYQRPDDEMQAIWQGAVEEARALLTGARSLS